MATVYAAQEPILDRLVAIKVIHPHLADEVGFADRFRQEARLVAGLRHSNIIKLHDFDILDGQHFMVMEYLEGGTLQARLKTSRQRNELIPLGEAARLLAEIGSALDYAHQRGAIHRDIKPANILFSTQTEPVVTDFGIAKLLTESIQISVTGGVIGTPVYMAPEQASGGTVDGRSDLYALGVIAFEMTTGRVPFQGDTPTAVMMQHLTAPPPPLRTINPNLPEGLERVILRCLAKNPQERFESASDFATAFGAALRGEPIQPLLQSPGPGLTGMATELDRPTPQASQSTQEAGAQNDLLSTPAEEVLEQLDLTAGQPVRPSRPQPAGQGRLRIHLWQLGVAFLLVALAVLGFTIFNQLNSQPATVVGDFTIAIGEFDGSQASLKVDFARRIYDQLESELQDQRATVNLYRTNEIYPDGAAARADLVERGASILIWGWYDDAGVSPHIELAGTAVEPRATRPAAFITAALAAPQQLNPGGSKLDLTVFAPYVRTPIIQTGLELFVDQGPEQIAYLSTAILGLAYEVEGDSDTALTFYNKALEVLSASENPQPAAELVFFQRAGLYSQENLYTEAAADLEQAIALAPKVYESWYNLALAYSETCDPARQLDQALEAAQTAINLRPDDVAAKILYASLALQAGQATQALTILDETKRLDPQNLDVLQLLGDVYHALGKQEEARSVWSQVLSSLGQAAGDGLDPLEQQLVSGDVYLKSGDADLALAAFQNAQTITADDPGVYQGLGGVYLLKEDYSAAVQAYERFAELDPANSFASISLGIAQQRAGQRDAAQQSYQHAANLNACIATPHLLLGGIAAEAGDFPEAEQAFQQAVDLEPQDPDSLYLLGVALLLQDKLDEAASALEIAIQLNPEYLEAHWALASVYYDLGSYDQALLEWQITDRMDPQQPQTLVSLGNTYDKLKDYSSAIQAYRQSLALKEDANVRVYLGLIYQLQGQLEQALAEYQLAVKLDSSNDLAYSGLGDILDQQGKLDEAAEAYEISFTLQPSPVLQIQLAILYARQGDLEPAIAALEQALVQDMQNAQARSILANLYGQAGDLDRAEVQYQQNLDVPAVASMAHAGLGSIAYKQCNLSRMAQEYTRALELAPNQAIFQSLQAYAAQVQGDDATANSIYADLQTAPEHDALAHWLVGEDHLRNDRLPEAEQELLIALENAGQLTPGLTSGIHNSLGQVYYLQDRFEPAVSEFSQALEDAAWNASAQTFLGDIAVRQGNLENARQFYLYAADLIPEYAFQYSADDAMLLGIGLQLRQGLISQHLGNSDEAESAFQTALAQAKALNDTFPKWPLAKFALGLVQTVLGNELEAQTTFSAAIECDRSMEAAIPRAMTSLKLLQPSGN